MKNSRFIVGGGKSFRQSNMEALRIIAMSMILILHFMTHALTPANMPHHLYYLLMVFVYSGVNIFFLISGYFSIKYSFKGFLRLILMIGFFGIVNLLLLTIVGDVPEPSRWITAILYPVTLSPYWFMQVYVLLYIVAPILNSGLKNLDRKTLRGTIIIFLAVVFYSRTGHIGGNFLHGAYLYCIGYYIRQYRPFERVSAAWWAVIFFFATGLSSAIGWSSAELFGGVSHYLYSYRNAFVVIAAVALVMCFRKFEFKNAAVNSIASASLGCYLLQDGVFGHNWFYLYQGGLLAEYGYGTKLFLAFTVIFVSYWVVSWLLTKFMNLWLPALSSSLDKGVRLIAAKVMAQRRADSTCKCKIKK